MADNIFDDVDEMLMEEAGLDEDKSFNDSELQDIMSEIEDLEKEFEAETATMTLQEQIDAEMMGATEEEAPIMEVEVEEEIEEEAEVEMQMEAETEVEEVIATPTPVAKAPEAQVLSFEKATPKTKPTTAEVSFAAHGQMALNLDFKIGEESACLSIDPVKGLVVTLSGVELCINEDSGCTVSMENGMKFTIPLSAQAKQDTSLKKKAV